MVSEIFKIMGFWLELGVSGFRVDGAPFLIERSEIMRYNVADPHTFLRDLKFFLTTRCGDAVLLPRPTSRRTSCRRTSATR